MKKSFKNGAFIASFVLGLSIIGSATALAATVYQGGQAMPDLSNQYLYQNGQYVYQGGQTMPTIYTSGQVMPTIYTSGQVMPSLQTSYSGGQIMPDLSGRNTIYYSTPSMVSNPNIEVKVVGDNLSQGSMGFSVTLLQQFLIDQNKGPAARALAQNGTTQYFGVLTHAALVEYQASVGLNGEFGNFGQATRAYISTHY